MIDINTHINWNDETLIDCMTIPARIESVWVNTANSYMDSQIITSWEQVYADLVSYGSDLATMLHREVDSEFTPGLERRLKLVTGLLNHIMLLRKLK